MLRIDDTIAGDPIRFHYAESMKDAIASYRRLRQRKTWAVDTESTGLNCYQPGWELRTFQFGNADESYVIPAKYRGMINGMWTFPGINWIGHNGTHDARCIDEFLGYDTGIRCVGETYIPAHHLDSRNQQEGGTGHGLKELAIAVVDRNAGKWEAALKREFKNIRVPVDGVYKSGPKRGQPRTRAARLAEGWNLIDPTNPAYIAYAASDPILTYRVWQRLYPVVCDFRKLYRFDLRVAEACDRLQRRALRIDVPYTRKLSHRYAIESARMVSRAERYGCNNIQSGAQIAETLQRLGVKLTERTPSGGYCTDNRVLRNIMSDSSYPTEARDFVRCVLVAKQLMKRRESYTEAMLREMDANGRVHPSINSLAARTARMSVSKPALQQLPTKDRESEVLHSDELI